MKGRAHAPDGARHFGLVVDDKEATRRALAEHRRRDPSRSAGSTSSTPTATGSRSCSTTRSSSRSPPRCSAAWTSSSVSPPQRSPSSVRRGSPRASPGWPSWAALRIERARRDRRRHVLRVLAVHRAVLELDHRVLPLSAQLLELVATALPERPLHDLVLGTGGVQCLLHPPAWMPVDLHPHVRAAVELDGHSILVSTGGPRAWCSSASRRPAPSPGPSRSRTRRSTRGSPTWPPGRLRG